MRTKDITRVAIFVAIAAISAIIVRFGGEAIVPFSLLPLVAVLAGSILGPRLGSLSMLVYIILGLIGLPIFAKSPYGGPTYLLQPTFGFLIGFMAAAFFSGYIIKKFSEPNYFQFALAMLAGIFVIYLFGLPYLYLILRYVTGTEIGWINIIKIGFLPFIGFDIVKAFLGAAIARPLVTRLKFLGYIGE